MIAFRFPYSTKNTSEEGKIEDTGTIIANHVIFESYEM